MIGKLICPNPSCAHETSPGDRFCQNCGRPLLTPDQAGQPGDKTTGAAGAGRQINTVYAPGGGVVAIGEGAKAIQNTGVYIESITMEGGGSLNLAQPDKLKCPKCQKAVGPQDHFCGSCGNKL